MSSLKVIEIAEKEIGYLEKATNSNLDSKTANAGKNNWTKYARDIDKINGFFNGAKNGCDWCAVFVSWCFVKAYGADRAKVLTCNVPAGAGCKYARQSYQNHGQLYSNPQVGDQIFFSGSDAGSIAHTGLVVGVTSDTVTTIEGNTSSEAGAVANGGCVRKKTYKRSYNRIAGYGRPAYSAAELGNEKKPIFPQKNNAEEDDDVDFKAEWDEMRRELQRGEPGEWSREAREWAIENGLVQGGENGYMWPDFATREQIVTILHRFAKTIEKMG